MVQEVLIWPNEQMVYTQPRIHPRKWNAQTSLGFWKTNGSPNLSQMIRPSDGQQKKRTCWIVDLAILADHRVKLKRNKKRDNFRDLPGELEKLLNMKVIVIIIVIGVLGKVTKGNHSNYSIVEIGQNTGKSPSDMLWLILQWKTIC